MALTGSRDPDLLILSNLTVTDLISFCQIRKNKYIETLCNNNNLWRNKYLSDFGNTEGMVGRDLTWRQMYFLRMFEKYTDQKALKEAAKLGFVDIIQLYNKVYPEFGLMGAIKGQHMDLIKYFTGRYRPVPDPFKTGDPKTFLWARVMKAAAKTGNREIINFFLDKGIRAWKMAMEGAAESNHPELVYFFTDMLDNESENEWMPNDWGLRAAAKGGNKELIKFFIDRGANRWNMGLQGAVAGNHRELIDYFISLGADDYDSALYEAAKKGNMELIEYFMGIVKRGRSPDPNKGLFGAARRGDISLMQYFIEAGADYWSRAIEEAEMGGHTYAINFLRNIEHDDDFDDSDFDDSDLDE